jgi:hypothetical protein
VQPPWKIVAVESAKNFPQGVEFKWNKVSDTKFEAEPALLNPQDVVSTHVYLTNTKYDVTSNPKEPVDVNVEWKARITNLLAFSEVPSPFSVSLNPSIAMIHLKDWSLFFTIAAAMLFEGLYLALLSRGGLLRIITSPIIFLVLGLSLLSFAAAESLATYLFRGLLSNMYGVDHSINAPWIVLHVAVLVVFAVKAWNSDVSGPRRQRLRSAS